nr:hypothetical protein [Tanacetum cinerariifolium]
VLAAPVIPISLDSSEESVGSYLPRVILFHTIPTNIPYIPVVPTEVPIAPADPLVAPKDSLPLAPELPLVSPFLCSDDSKADNESELAELAWRRVSHCSSNHHSSSDFTSDSSSSSSSSDSSSDISSVRTPRCSEPFMRWRSHTTLVPSSTPVSGSITLALADLPPRKRFKDLYSSKDSGEEHMEIGTAEAKAVANLGISDGVGAHTEDGIVDLLVTGGISKPTGGDAPDLEGTLYDIAHYMSKVTLDRITEFETTQRQLEAGQLVASEERAGLADRVRSLGWENLRVRALLCIERDRVDSLR